MSIEPMSYQRVRRGRSGIRNEADEIFGRALPHEADEANSLKGMAAMERMEDR